MLQKNAICKLQFLTKMCDLKAVSISTSSFYIGIYIPFLMMVNNRAKKEPMTYWVTWGLSFQMLIFAIILCGALKNSPRIVGIFGAIRVIFLIAGFPFNTKTLSLQTLDE